MVSSQQEVTDFARFDKIFGKAIPDATAGRKGREICCDDLPALIAGADEMSCETGTGDVEFADRRKRPT